MDSVGPAPGASGGEGPESSLPLWRARACVACLKAHRGGQGSGAPEIASDLRVIQRVEGHDEVKEVGREAACERFGRAVLGAHARHDPDALECLRKVGEEGMEELAQTRRRWRRWRRWRRR